MTNAEDAPGWVDSFRSEVEGLGSKSLRWWLGRFWFLPVIVLTTIVLTPELVRWAMELALAGSTIGAGFTTAFEYTSVAGYVFFGVFRAVPYVFLAVPLTLVALTRARPYVWPIFVGGYAATTWFIVTGFWGAQRAYYTGEHVSSTTALAYVFVPIFACIAMVIGALVATVLFAVARAMIRLGRRRCRAGGQTAG